MPTLMFITLVFLAWLGKALLTLTTLSVERLERDPMVLTHGLLGIVWATFAAIAGVAQVIK